MRKNKKSILVIVIIVAAALGLMWGFGGARNASSKSTRELAMSCTLDMYTKFHIHPRLAVIINEEKQTLPPNIGVTFGCMHPLHTHDDTGEIHVESPEKRDFTLGDFFAVWGKPFTKDQILDSKVDGAHEIVMTVNGKSNNEFENLVLRDKEEIIIEYRDRK